MCDDWGEDENVTKVGPKEDDDWGNNTSSDNNYKSNGIPRGRGRGKIITNDLNDDWGEDKKTSNATNAGDEWADDWGNNKPNDNRGQNSGRFGGQRSGGRACHKCGEEGHFSRECPNNKGGNGCRRCGEEGHYAKDCPNNKGGRACHKCGEEGHISRDCSKSGGDWGQENGTSGQRRGGRTCHKCKEEGHFAKDCPKSSDDTNDWGDSNETKDDKQRSGGSGCRRCGEEGHFAKNCPNKGEGNSGNECRRCKKEGHKASDCTEEIIGEDGKPLPPIYKPVLIDENSDNLYDCVPTGINFDRYEKIKVNVSGDDIPKPINAFKDVITSDLINTAIDRCKYTKPTPVQKYAIPIIMQKRDLMACAQTGSGKTAAFELPVLQDLLSMSDLPSLYGQPVQEPLCVVISPTRELAIQIHTEAVKFAKGSIIKPALIYGGTSSGYQLANISRGAHFLVATPGRLLDFVNKGKISFAKLKYLILDEADRMIDQGFLPEVRRMVTHETMPHKSQRQTLMFSATFPDEVQNMAKEFLKDDYLFLTVGIVGSANSDVEQTFIEVDGKQKKQKLMDILKSSQITDRTLVFVEKKKTADFLASYLSQQEMKSTSIHGDRYQSQRETALYDFRSGRMPILVATSVAARGLDIKDVKHVINYDLPKDIDEYVHRIGRTGRVGNVGKATSFFDLGNDSDVSLAKNLIKILSDANQAVPDFLSNSASGNVGFNSASNRTQYGGKDVRGDNGNNEADDWD